MNDELRDYYLKLAPMLLGWLRTQTRRTDLAEEIAGEVWLKVCRAYETQFDGANFQGWLFQIASRTLADYFRKRKPVSGSELPEPVSSQDNPLEGLLSEEQARIFQDCFQQLPDDRRIVVQARSRGESYAEISESLSIPVNTATSRYDRAKKQLRDCVEKKT